MKILSRLFCRHQYEYKSLVYRVDRDSNRLQLLGIEKFVKKTNFKEPTYSHACNELIFKTYTHTKLVNTSAWTDKYDLTILFKECIKCGKRTSCDVVEAKEYFEDQKFIEEAMKEL